MASKASPVNMTPVPVPPSDVPCGTPKVLPLFVEYRLVVLEISKIFPEILNVVSFRKKLIVDASLCKG